MEHADASTDLASFERNLTVEANAALRRSALFALALGGASVVTLPVLVATGLLANLLVPWIFTAAATACSAAIYLLAKRGAVRGAVAYAALLPFAFLPSLLFLANAFVTPGGAATFLTGPISYLYAVVIVVAGSVFDARLSVAAGLVGGAGYLLSYALGRHVLQQVSTPDPLLTQDLSQPTMYVLRALMIVFVGVTVGGLARVVRRLVLRTLGEEREKNMISRLFGQYVSEEVKERILRDPAAKASERKEVVVLFSDLRGFTSYSESADPEEIVARLNAWGSPRTTASRS